MSNTTETTMKSKTFLLTGLMAFAASATTVVITSPDGGRAVADTYGARLVSWRPADGEEVFALPKPYDKCPREAGVQIHGGLPIYWPWFVFEGPEGCKIHGVTSYAEWKVKERSASRVVFELDDTPATRAAWPHPFHLELAYELGDTLTATFKATNTGPEPYSCTEGFHPYFRVGDTMRCTVTGTDGARYFWKGEADKGDRRRWKGDFPASLVAVGKPGYVFEERDGPHRHQLKDPVLNRAIDVTFEGNIKIVMWNSGPDFGQFGSADDPSYGSRFLCLEGATLYRDRAYTLAPGASHTLKATIAVKPFKPARFAMEGLSPAVYYDAAHAVTAGDPDADVSVIVIHGWGGGVKPSSRESLRAGLTERGVKPFIVSPLFPSRIALEKAKIRDGRAMWCNWKDNIRSPADDWRGGGDASGTSISSFDVVDRLIATLSDKNLYPAMKRIVLLGLSAGGQFVGRYVAVGKCPVRPGLTMEFAGIAPSTELRLDDDVEWHYGLKNRPRYSAALSRDAILANLSSRRVWRGCGTLDVTPGALDKSPEAMMQGINRYDRFRNFQEYIKAFPGWAKQVSFHDIPGVGHSGKTFDDPNLLDFVSGK